MVLPHSHQGPGRCVLPLQLQRMTAHSPDAARIQVEHAVVPRSIAVQQQALHLDVLKL